MVGVRGGIGGSGVVVVQGMVGVVGVGVMGMGFLGAIR